MRFVTLLVAAFLLAAPALAQERPQIVTVSYPLQYLAERLVSDSAEVTFPIPADVDPSFWRPSISDISAVQSADLILLNGAGFAAWVDRVSLPRSRLLNTSSGIRDQFISTQSITHSHGDGGEHSHEGVAAYTWLDPTLAIAQAETIALALAGRGLTSVEEVDQRLEALRQDFLALDEASATALTGADDVAMIATHPRYQYLARRYGLTITSLEWEAAAAPNDDQLATLQDMIAETGARILIWEATPPESALTATAALGLQNVIFPPLAHGEAADDYIDTMTASVDGLAKAVQAAQAN